MTAPDLPALTGSPVLDPWRIRYRLVLAGELEQPARHHRETPTERALWEVLEHEPPGWQREYSTGLYRLDFFCPQARLAVEVDGGSHYGREASQRDALRDDWHRARGVSTKRFSAREVENYLPWVVSEIRALVLKGSGPDVAPEDRAPVPARERVPTAVAETLTVDEPAAAAGLQHSVVVTAEDWADRAMGEDGALLKACLTVLPVHERRLLSQLVRVLDL